MATPLPVDLERDGASRSTFLIEHDLRANASRLSRGKTGIHPSGRSPRACFSGSPRSSPNADRVVADMADTVGRNAGDADMGHADRGGRHDGGANHATP